MTRPPRSRSLAAALFAALAIAVPARADDRGYDGVIVQNRDNFGHHELGLSLGLLPMDAFTKGFTVGASYTLRFDEVLGWEIAHVLHSFPVDSGLRDELLAFDLEPQTFEVVETAVFSNFVWTPIYWKGSVMNESLVLGEILFMVGPGVAWFTRSTRGGFDAGLALRLYLSSLVSVRLDVRYQGFFEDTPDGLDLHNEIWTGLGVAFTP